MPQAIPIVVAVASSAAAAASTGILAATAFTVLGTAVTVGTLLAAALSIGGALLSVAMQPKPKATESQIQSRLGGVSAAPPYRYIYGRARIGGYRVFTHVSGDTLYLGYIFNSRPSHLIETVEFDTRSVGWASDSTNDAYDMLKGADVSTDPFSGLVRMWVGLGDQVTPPQQFLDEITDDDVIQSSDAWRGLTVAWFRLSFGDSNAARDRWIATPPDIRIVGQWSKVWDPRDTTQSESDPHTWSYSDNAALCTLDMVRDARGMNRLIDLVDVESFRVGANICDNSIALSDGGFEPRYAVAGVIEMGVAETQKVTPLLDAAAARLVDISGRATFLPGVWREPSLTLADIVGSHMEYIDLRESADAPNTIRTSIVAENRGWQETEVPVLQDATALSADNGIARETRLDLPLVASPTQAMRLQQIALRRARHEKALTAEFPPAAYASHAGDVVSVSLPGFPPANGVYEVTEFEPRLVSSGDGMTMTIALTLIETSEYIYEWDPLTDEAPFPSTTDIDNTPTALASPTDLMIIVAAREIGNGESAPVAQVMFTASTSAAVVAYQVQRRASGGVWQDATVSSAEEDVNVVEVENLTAGAYYDFRVYAVARDGRRSVAAQADGVLISAPNSNLPPPELHDIYSPYEGAAEVVFRAPDDAGVRGLRIYGGYEPTISTMNELAAFAATPNQLFGLSDTQVTPGETRYYTAYSTDAWSGFSSPAIVASVVVSQST